jgi:hypothetical protein
MDQFADVLDGRVREEVVPGLVIVPLQDVPQDLLQIGEVHHHAVAEISFHNQLDFVRVTVRCAALRVVWKKVSTVRVANDADLHAESAE